MQQKIVRHVAIALAGVVGTAPVVHAAPPEVRIAEADPEVTAIVAELQPRHGVPGLAAGWFAIDKTTGELTGAVGVAGRRNSTEDAELGDDDPFHLGSCTKAMTATLVGLLIEEGRLRWDDRPTVLLADVFDEAEPDEGYGPVTLEDLLTHRSALPANVAWPEIASGGGSVTAQRRRVVASALGTAPTTPRGTYLYSNAGYAVAGAMLECVTEEEWEELMRARLFRPLRMESAGFGPPPGGPIGHFRRDEQWHPTPVDNPPVLGPAGTVHASLADWARFVAVHLDPRWAEAIGIEPATVAHLQTPPDAKHGYACGWGTEGRGAARRLTHDGSNTLWYASVRAHPASGRFFLAATNAGTDAARAACHAAIERLEEEP